jgi:beta-ribofuranosylaminobenzene 5'-phosphate synthase
MIRIQTGRRLHFGLFSPLPVPELDLVYGGLGVMVDAPGVVVAGSPSNGWSVTGFQKERGEGILGRLIAAHPALTPINIKVEYMAPAHQGWGTGSQLAMAIAQMCYKTSQLEWNAPDAAKLVGRGQRSGIGIVGFDEGGLLLDHGKSPGTDRPGQVESLPMPLDWTFVLVEPGQEQGLHSEEERRAFSRLSKINVGTVSQLRTLAKEVLIPASNVGDFDRFARHLTEYNRLAGSFYHGVQHGDYGTQQTEERLALMEKHGAVGRGQSSWGPGLFAVFPTPQKAQTFCERCPLPGCRLIMAQVMKPSIIRFVTEPMARTLTS